jgi:hypothetical protein
MMPRQPPPDDNAAQAISGCVDAIAMLVTALLTHRLIACADLTALAQRTASHQRQNGASLARQAAVDLILRHLDRLALAAQNSTGKR